MNPDRLARAFAQGAFHRPALLPSAYEGQRTALKRLPLCRCQHGDEPFPAANSQRQMLPGARHPHIGQTPLAGLLRLEAIHAQQEDMGKIQTFGAVDGGDADAVRGDVEIALAPGERCYCQQVAGSA